MEPKKLLGIVLSSSPINEYDKRVVLLTREAGKISAFARNAKKLNNSLTAATMPFTFGEFDIYEGKSSNTLVGASPSNYFSVVHNDLDMACFGMYFLELADYFTREYNDEKEMLRLLYQSLRAMESGKFSNNFIRTVYEWKTLVINGTYPDISGSDIKKKYQLSNSAMYAIRFITSSTVEKLYTFKVDDYVLGEMLRFTSDMIDKYVDKKLNSLRMLEDIRSFEI